MRSTVRRSIWLGENSPPEGSRGASTCGFGIPGAVGGRLAAELCVDGSAEMGGEQRRDRIAYLPPLLLDGPSQTPFVRESLQALDLGDAKYAIAPVEGPHVVRPSGLD